MRSVSILLVLLASTSGCRSLLGLDDPTVVPPDASADGPNSDRDGDGFANEVDVCPDIEDPLQRDHDGDDVGDLCDTCPHIPDPSTPGTIVDRDGDGVGDLCDPNPTTGNDHIVGFAGFYEGSDIAGLERSGTWTVSAGRLQTTAMESMSYIVFGMLGRVSVATQVRFDDDQFFSSSSAVTVASTVGSSVTQPIEFAACSIQGELATYVTAQSHSLSTGMLEDQREWPGSTMRGAFVDIALRRATDALNCQFSQGLETVLNSVTDRSADGKLVLMVAQASVSFDYLFVVEPG